MKKPWAIEEIEFLKKEFFEDTEEQYMKPTIHELKTWNEYFSMVFSGSKSFEVRKNDRDFKLLDEVLLREFDPNTEKYTGRILHRRISYIFKGGQFGIEEGYVVLGLQTI